MSTKYKKHYDLLITKRTDQQLIDRYYETHHIIPRSLGGLDKADNLVRLTAREHFIAHILLFKHYTAINDASASYKMALAIQLLKNGKVGSLSTFVLGAGSASVYEKAKIIISEKMTGSGNPMFGRISGNKGKTHKEMYSPTTLKLIEESYIAKRKTTEIYDWVHDTKKHRSCTIYELAESEGFDHRKLLDVVNTTTDRKVSHGWSVKGIDTRNKYIREQANKVYSFYRLDGDVAFDVSIDYMVNTYDNLTYEGLRNVV